MKAEILMLQPYDNIDSVLDRLTQIYNASRGLTRIQIVWPKRGRILHESLDYARIAGWADRHSLQVVFIARDEAVLRFAEEHHIAAYQDAAEVPSGSGYRYNRFPLKRSYSQRVLNLTKYRSEYEKLQRKPPSLKRELPFLLLGILGFLLALYCVLPHAVIRLKPVARTRELKLPLWTSAQLNALTMNGGIPSELVSFTVNERVTVPSTGTIESAGSLAVGTVSFTNTCDRSQTVPAGVHLSAAADQPWLFHTLAEIVLPAGEQQNFPIEADEAGEKYNLAPDTLSAIQVPHDRCIQVTQPDAASGGTNGRFRSPTEADYQTASERIREIIMEQEAALTAERAGALYYILPDSFTLGKVIKETMDPPFGYAGETFTLGQQIEVSFRMVALRNIYSQVKFAFELFPEAGFVPENNRYDFRIVPDSNVFENEQYHFAVIGEQNGLSGLDAQTISRSVQGLALEDALRTIEVDFSTESNPKIEIWPPGFNRLPIAASNISVVLE